MYFSPLNRVPGGVWPLSIAVGAESDKLGPYAKSFFFFSPSQGVRPCTHIIRSISSRTTHVIDSTSRYIRVCGIGNSRRFRNCGNGVKRYFFVIVCVLPPRVRVFPLFFVPARTVFVSCLSPALYRDLRKIFTYLRCLDGGKASRPHSREFRDKITFANSICERLNDACCAKDRARVIRDYTEARRKFGEGRSRSND